MAVRVLGIALALACVGCGKHYESLSAGSVGCPPDAITVSDVNTSGAATTWRAVCAGRTFDCTLTPAGTVNCAPER